MNEETYYIKLLKNIGNTSDNVIKYLVRNNGDGYSKIVRLCVTLPRLKKLINYDECFSNKFEHPICDGINLSLLPIDKLVLFFSLLIENESDRINKFLMYKRRFEHYVLTKQYDIACELLNEIYDELGLSLWLLDSCSVITTLSDKKILFLDSLDVFENANFSILSMKNNLGERQSYYARKHKSMIESQNFNVKLMDFLKYILFIAVPKSDVEWKNIFINSCLYSLIDIYLCLVDFLQKKTNSKNKFLCGACLNIEKLDDEKNKIVSSMCRNKMIDFDDNISSDLVESFWKKDYSDVIEKFYSNDYMEYNVFNTYVLTAIAYLVSNEEPNYETAVLNNVIVELMYNILKRDGELTIYSIDRLSIIARLLKSFDIHKGICVFLDLVANYESGYSFEEQFATFTDVKILSCELNESNLAFLPYKYKYATLSEEIELIYINNYDNCEYSSDFKGLYFLKEAYIALQIKRLICKGCTEKAVSVLVDAYVENKLLLFVSDNKDVVNHIINKVNSHFDLSIEELCYVFIDYTLVNFRRDSFLNFIDSAIDKDPIEIVEGMRCSERVAYFFLNNVCGISMLREVYWMFYSSDEVNDYRIKICDLLVSKYSCANKKALIEEKEEITKNSALSKKLKEFQKGKLTINAESFKNKCYDTLIELVHLYNNTKAKGVEIEPFTNGMYIVKYTDNHYALIKSAYEVYCREFCFGDYGIDMSLSTRVRHGTLSNRILKIFSDNNLTCDGHGNNSYFESFIANGQIDSRIRSELLSFIKSIKDILNYFTQHTLKVVIDDPIEGAVFNFEYREDEFELLYAQFEGLSNITIDDIASVFNAFLIEKTNQYLMEIQRNRIAVLKDSLISVLSDFSATVKKYILSLDVGKEIDRLIVNCNTGVQTELSAVSQWFAMSEYNKWENYTFADLVDMCKEIDKSLFTNFDKIKFSCEVSVKGILKGETFRHLVDIMLILFNNAINHSGFIDDLGNLNICCSFTEDSKYLYVVVENNLGGLDLFELDNVIEQINDDFEKKNYLKINTRQEGGMGLYKIMHTLFSVIKYGQAFYVSRTENIFRVEMQIVKEILCDEESIDGR